MDEDGVQLALRVTESPDVYTFGETLQDPRVQEVRRPPVLQLTAACA